MPVQVTYAQSANESIGSVFVEGYTFAVPDLDFQSAEILNDIKVGEMEGQVIQERKVVDVDSLNRVCSL
jgi:hypothetical protein